MYIKAQQSTEEWDKENRVDGHVFITCPHCNRGFYSMVVVTSDEYLSDFKLTTLAADICPHCNQEVDTSEGALMIVINPKKCD